MEDQHLIEQLKEIARQLACPEGTQGIKTGEMMHQNNLGMTLNAIRALNLQAGEMVLEIGHGNAAHVEQLLSEAPDLTYFGADISTTMHREAQKINAKYIDQNQAKFVLSDPEKLPFEQHTFDKIFTVNTLYFWQSPLDYLQEIKRLLKPSGRFILCFADQSFMEKLPFTAFGFKLYPLKQVEEFLKASGFKILELKHQTEQVTSNAGQAVEREYHLLSAEAS